jgi:Skp family chaperone for outer membrane proteins
VEELVVLRQCAELVGKLDEAKKQVKAFLDAINEKLLAKYKDLDEAEVKKLALIKWESALESTVELDRARIPRTLADRISVIGKRYDIPLQTVIKETADLEAIVRRDLAEMNLEW